MDAAQVREDAAVVHPGDGAMHLGIAMFHIKKEQIRFPEGRNGFGRVQIEKAAGFNGVVESFRMGEPK